MGDLRYTVKGHELVDCWYHGIHVLACRARIPAGRNDHAAPATAASLRVGPLAELAFSLVPQGVTSTSHVKSRVLSLCLRVFAASILQPLVCRPCSFRGSVHHGQATHEAPARPDQCGCPLRPADGQQHRCRGRMLLLLSVSEVRVESRPSP